MKPLLVFAACLAVSCGDSSPIAGQNAGGAGAAGAAGANAATGGNATVSTGGPLPEEFEVSGVVVDQDGAPVEGALVMQAGGTPRLTTGPDGMFSVTLTQSIPGEPTVAAAKIGYRSAGETLLSFPIAAVTLVLIAIEPPDNALGYSFGEPGVGDPSVDNSTAFCGHCHTTLTAQFQTSKHAQATKSPIVQDMYAATASGAQDATGCAQLGGTWRTGTEPGAPGATLQRCYIGDGVLPDLNECGAVPGKACDDPTLSAAQQPTDFGACADCHGFGMDGPAGGRDLLEAAGVGFENGVHCDACHHVRDVDLSKPPGGGGRLIMQRPREKLSDEIGAETRQAMFGPYPDVPNPFMGGSYQPKFSEAEFCAGCHSQRQQALLPGSALDPQRWPDGLPTHDTYQEWLDGPFSQTDTPCQSCHMPEETSLFSTVDVASASNASITFGFGRPEGTIRGHWFRGPLTAIPAVPRLLEGALALNVSAQPSGSLLQVDVTSTNAACGHALPTGEPMRSIILVVRVDGCGDVFDAVDGQTIDAVGGMLAEGSLGSDAVLVGTSLDWPAGAALAVPGQVVHFVRPSGVFDDYDGVGLFQGPQLPPQAKGLELREPVGTATVVSVAGTTIVLSEAITVSAGDLAVLGDAAPPTFDDGASSLALAGYAGSSFAKVLVDPQGRERVPHHRAIDIVRDNRIRPQISMVSSYGFSIPPACTQATVTATALYRPFPLELARERGWGGRDYVATEVIEVVTIP